MRPCVLFWQEAKELWLPSPKGFSRFPLHVFFMVPFLVPCVSLWFPYGSLHFSASHPSTYKWEMREPRSVHESEMLLGCRFSGQMERCCLWWMASNLLLGPGFLVITVHHPFQGGFKNDGLRFAVFFLSSFFFSLKCSGGWTCNSQSLMGPKRRLRTLGSVKSFRYVRWEEGRGHALIHILCKRLETYT